jgi:hypothetical protein
MKTDQSVYTTRAGFEAGLPRSVSAIIWSFALFFPLLAINHQSLWIDEGITANAAMQSTLRNCWKSLAAVNGSDLQMPFYMSYIWAWQKIFGGSEIALRLANYPWFILGQIAGAFIWPDRRKGLLFIVIAASNAFIWFYLNEARPYIMEYGAACVALCLLWSFVREGPISRGKYWLLSLTVIVLAGANMLGVAWSGTTILVAAFLFRKKHLRPSFPPIVFCASMFVILGCYYVWTLLAGARGATLPTRLLLNAFYLPYELGGFAGLGPGRLDIRTHGLSSFSPFIGPLVVFALIWTFVFLRAVRVSSSPKEKGGVLATLAYSVPPLIFLFLVGVLAHFNVLGRHAMPSLPLVFVLCTLGLWSLWQDRNVLGRAIVSLFFVLSIVSCLGIRLLPQHARDDYRGAAAAVSRLVADNSIVWWCANRETARYYRLPVTERSNEARQVILAITSPTRDEIAALPPPTIVVLSKADIYDSYGTITAMMRDQRFVQYQTLQAFTIWRKP